jgi:CRISPR-associated protein Csx17
MPEPHTHILEGCRPTPLASYLKALGILRLVAEQKDAHARGSWHADRFHLRTTLDREALLRFLLEEYRPTPIIAPWNGRAGFLEGENDGGEGSTRAGAQFVRAYASTAAPRFGYLKQAVEAFFSLPTIKELDETRAAVKVIDKLAKSEKRKPTDEEKKKDGGGSADRQA